MISSRRLHYNFALDRALEYCAALHKPLVIFEALRIGYQWANDRIHRFVLDGMADNAAVLPGTGVRYYPYIEPTPGAGKGLFDALAADSCVVMTDNFPCFFLPRMVSAAAKRLSVLLESVDSNGLLPLYATVGYSVERLISVASCKEHYPSICHLFRMPIPWRLQAYPVVSLSRRVTSNWPMVSKALLSGEPGYLNALPIDHAVKPAAEGGATARPVPACSTSSTINSRATANAATIPTMTLPADCLHFCTSDIYRSTRSSPSSAAAKNGRRRKLSLRSNGSREGWWNMSLNADSFLDELITWREVGYNFSSHREDYDKYASLPDWVRKTLNDHTEDEREHVYTLEQFESGRTRDLLWNAAQMQLVREGRIHNYLRMLWGKKILQWTRTPEEAAKIMIHLNNKYGLDGRNPNSYSGIFWVLGRYDRPWAPIRPIFGSIRYMSSENTARKSRQELSPQVRA